MALDNALAGKTLVYLAGYGRSGSTLLGRIMSLQGTALDLGEVVMAPRFLDRPKHYCACGERLKDCRIWSTLPEAAEATAPLTQVSEAMWPCWSRSPG